MKNEIRIFGPIGRDGITADAIRSQLEAADQRKMLTVRMHSEGGEVFEGFAIHDAFLAYKGQKRLIIESAAFSIASFIAMAFDDVEIAANGFLMLHNPHVATGGDHTSHAKAADMLTKLRDGLIAGYAKRSGKSRDAIAKMLDAETWLSAEEAVAAGFAKRITAAHVRERRAAASAIAIPPAVERAVYGAVASGDSTRRKKMSVSIAELRHAMPKASAEFLLSAVERELSVADALAEYVAQLEGQLVQRGRSVGMDPIPVNHAANWPNASAAWREKIDAEVSRLGGRRDLAIMNVNRKYPGLREAMLAEFNR